MSKKLFKTAMVAALFATAPSVLAQSYVPSVGVPAPTSIQDYERCDQIMVGFYDTKTFKACLDGQEEAKYTAERFAKMNGKLHGYLEGFSYALFKAAQVHNDDAEEVARGRAALDANGSDMQAGLQAGIDKGNKEGSADGKSDALQTWDSAFRNGQLPAGGANSHYSLSVPTYRPDISDPYDRFVGRKTVQDIMRQDIDQGLRNVVVQIQGNEAYLLDRTNYSLWDLWFDNGRYEIERYKNGRWVNAQESFKFWVDTAGIRQFDINDYQNLPSQYQDGVHTTTRTVTNPDGTTSQVTEPTIVNLKQTFKDGFIESYKYYMHHNFNSGFHEYLGLGASAGEMTGVQVGKRIAFENGYASAYNEKFQSEAQRTYGQAYSNSYMGTFDSVFNDYASSAKLNVTNIEKIGEVDDGIFSPGERVKFVITVENRGGREASNLSVNVSGDITRSESQELGTLNRLDADTFETDFIAKISEGHDVRQNVRLVLSLTGDNGANDTIDTSIDVRNQIETTGSASLASVNAIEGTARVELPIKNVSTQDAKNITADVKIDGQIVATANLGTIAGGNTRVASIQVTGLNPLKMLEGIRAQIVMKTNGVLIDEADGSTEIKSRNTTKDIATIFTKVAKGQRVSGVSLDEAQAKLIAMDRLQTSANRKGTNVYKKMPDTTIPGQLVLQKGSSTDSPATEAFNSVAVKMWVNNRKNLPGFLSGKRKAYRKLLDQLTIVGKVKKAAKGKK
jgi:uncharacterized protein YbjQ (UPF0145 family)